ncbi:hypothetical protein AB5I41_08585 [Sphingomonas sp. MMS24-JH45]
MAEMCGKVVVVTGGGGVIIALAASEGAAVASWDGPSASHRAARRWTRPTGEVVRAIVAAGGRAVETGHHRRLGRGAEDRRLRDGDG